MSEGWLAAFIQLIHFHKVPWCIVSAHVHHFHRPEPVDGSAFAREDEQLFVRKDAAVVHPGDVEMFEGFPGIVSDVILKSLVGDQLLPKLVLK